MKRRKLRRYSVPYDLYYEIYTLLPPSIMFTAQIICVIHCLSVTLVYLDSTGQVSIRFWPNCDMTASLCKSIYHRMNSWKRYLKLCMFQYMTLFSEPFSFSSLPPVQGNLFLCHCCTKDSINIHMGSGRQSYDPVKSVPRAKRKWMKWHKREKRRNRNFISIRRE